MTNEEQIVKWWPAERAAWSPHDWDTLSDLKWDLAERNPVAEPELTEFYGAVVELLSGLQSSICRILSDLAAQKPGLAKQLDATYLEILKRPAPLAGP
jgi:hypothetical protein